MKARAPNLMLSISAPTENAKQKSPPVSMRQQGGLYFDG
jgi:hypothetical protein